MLKNIKYDERYINYLYQFNVTRNYYYCHDLLEDIWMEDKDNYGVIKYLLQLAVMQYKKVKNNEKGFNSLLKKTVERFGQYESSMELLGIDTEKLKSDIITVNNSKTLYDFELMIVDEKVKKLYDTMINCFCLN